MRIQQILAKREEIRSQMQALVEAHPGEMPAEIASKFDTLKAEAEALNAQEARAAAIADLDRRSAGTPLTGDANFNNLLAGYSLTRALAVSAGLASGGREAEVNQELRRSRHFEGFAVPLDAVRYTPRELRAVTAAGAGAPLISTEIGPVIDRLRNASMVQRAGATFLAGLTANVSFPRIAASATAQWVADGSALTLTDPSTNTVSLTPHSVGALTEYSRQTLLQASPDVDNLIRSDLSKVLAAAIDLGAIAGTGTGAQPTGVLNTAGIGSVAMGTNGAALTYAAVQDLVASVANANGEGDTMAFITNTKVRTAVRKMLDAQNRPLGEAVVFGDIPAIYSNAVTSAGTKGTGTNLSTLLYGNWSDLLIGVFGALDIVSNPYGDGYARGAVQVRAFAAVDVAPRHAASFGAITDIAA